MSLLETPRPMRRSIGIPPSDPANARSARGVFWPPEPPKPPIGQGERFEQYVRNARASLKTRRGVLLHCTKANPCRVPFFRVVDGEQVWPNRFSELRENLRAAEPLALNEVDAYAMWTQTDILRVARAVWEDFEVSPLSDSNRRAEILRDRAREEERIEARKERARQRREDEDARRRADPDYVPYSAPKQAKRDPLVSVDQWREIGAPHLDDELPLNVLTRNNAYLMKYGEEAPARCNQITAGEFMRRCVGRLDVPLKGWSIFAAQALDHIPGWTRSGKKRHHGSVAVVWRRDGAQGEFSLVEQATGRRRRVM